jgi:ABC-type phosphate/phosphonate transport system substrate-binding protein
MGINNHIIYSIYTNKSNQCILNVYKKHFIVVVISRAGLSNMHGKHMLRAPQGSQIFWFSHSIPLPYKSVDKQLGAPITLTPLIINCAKEKSITKHLRQ